MTVTVSGNGATPTGTVVLSSGSYASFSATLSSGSAQVTIPAGLLPVASNDTLTASYTPDASSLPTYNSASGTASIAITLLSDAPPTVTATTVTYPTSGAPFQAAVTSTGTVLVSEPHGIEVFTPGTTGLTSSCVNDLSSSLLSDGASVSNLSILPNGVDVAAGIGSAGAAFFNLAALETCSATPYVVSQGPVSADEGSQEVDVTPDGKYAFVSNEYGVVTGQSGEGNIGVVALQYDAAGDVTTGTLAGQIATGGEAIAGMTLSPDGTRLYVTSEVATSSTAGAGAGNPILAESDCVQGGGNPQLNGLLTVIDVAKAESAPGQSAILATVDAGCSPVRMAETADGSVLWVAARGDNRVLAFSTGMLEYNAANALLGYAGTGGTAPVGIKLFDKDQLLAVANSNRFGTGPTANATILSVAVPAAANVVQTISTGDFPREIWVGSDDATLYLTNYDSDSLEVISTVTQ